MIGERIGNYVITEKLGEGGMGEVYLAAHPTIGKRVALKVLHPELAANEEITTRFFHEAKAVNSISHPNIVDIVDYGSLATERGNIVYLVMELLAGATLTKALEQGPLEPTRAVKIVKQVADALVASHDHGIIHRDLKPDNIMLVARGREPEFVKLLDFGIAKVQDGKGGSSSKTRTGMVIGTPVYMSPEQCEGRGDIDHRTDVYALGTVLYELLTGAPPFSGTGYAEVLVKQLTEMPEPVTSRRPGISRYIESIVMKSLAKRPADRFQTMREMLEALSNPQEFVDARGGVATFSGARGNPPTGPQMPTPYLGNPSAPYIPTPAPYTPGAYGASVGMPATPTPYGVSAAIATPYGASAAIPTPYGAGAGAAIPTPYSGTGGAGIQTPYGQTPGPQTGVGPSQTTLSHGVGEVPGRPGTLTGTKPGRGTLIAAIIGGAAVVGGIVAVLALSGGGDKSSSTVAAGGGSTDTTPTPTPTPPDPTPKPPDPTPTPTPTNGSAGGGTSVTATGSGSGSGGSGMSTTTPPAAATVKIKVESTPPGAAVFVAAEPKQRCVTPCSVDVPRDDRDTAIVVRLAGYADDKRTVSAKTDSGLNLELVKKKSGTTRPGTPPGGQGSATGPKKPKGPVGDNTLNPFDN